MIAPFFISYLMRMLAWINLLQDDGWVNDVLVWVGILDAPRNWLDGRASSVILGLVYGYVPFMILPLYAFLDRIDKSLLEAARDLGASPFQAFRMVTLPLSMPAILAGIVIIALPMFGDYYTPDLLSQSPSTSMIGNQIVLYIQGGQQIPVGAALVVVLMLFLSVLMGYYLYATARAQRRLGGSTARLRLPEPAHEAPARLVGEPVGEAALPRALHARSTSSGRSSRSSSRSGSRSTRAARARRRRAGRCAGTRRTPTSRCSHDPALSSALAAEPPAGRDRRARDRPARRRARDRADALARARSGDLAQPSRSRRS